MRLQKQGREFNPAMPADLGGGVSGVPVPSGEADYKALLLIHNEATVARAVNDIGRESSIDAESDARGHYSDTVHQRLLSDGFYRIL